MRDGDYTAMWISPLCLGAAVLLWMSFSWFPSPHVSMQDAGIADLDRSQSESVSNANQEAYASDPDHIWNRLFRLFYVRRARNGDRYGGDELDPYLWERTKYLLSGP